MYQIDAMAQRALDQMVAAHQALFTFSCRVRTEATSERRRETSSATLAYLKPNHLRLELQRTGKAPLLFVSDGTNRVSPARRGKADSGEKVLISLLTEANLFIAPPFLFLVSRMAPITSLLPGPPKTLGFGNPTTLDGVAVVVVAADITTRAGNARLTFSVGKDDHLLRKLSVETAFEKENLTLTEYYTAVKANPTLDKSLFALPR